MYRTVKSTYINELLNNQVLFIASFVMNLNISFHTFHRGEVFYAKIFKSLSFLNAQGQFLCCGVLIKRKVLIES